MQADEFRRRKKRRSRNTWVATIAVGCTAWYTTRNTNLNYFLTISSFYIAYAFGSLWERVNHLGDLIDEINEERFPEDWD